MAKKIFKTRGTRTDYPSDVSDEEWAFCAPYLTLMKEEAWQRDYTLRGLFNALRYMIPGGVPLAHDPQRSASLVDGASTSPALDQGWML